MNTGIKPYFLALTSILLGAGLLFFLCWAYAQDPLDASWSLDFGDSCELDITGRLLLDGSGTRVSGREGPELFFTRRGRLFLDGRELALNSSQKQQLREFEAGLQEFAPGLLKLTNQSMEFAMDLSTGIYRVALNRVPPASVEKALDKLRAELQKGLREGDGKIFVDGAALDNIDEAVETAVRASLAEFFLSLGALLDNRDATLTERFTDFGARMGTWGEEMEEEVDRFASEMEVVAEQLCETLEQLQEQEEALRTSVPELRDFVLFSRS